MTQKGRVRAGQVICCYPGLSYFYVCQGYIDQYGLNLRWPRGARDHILTLEGQVWIDANPRISIVTHSQKNHMWVIKTILSIIQQMHFNQT